MISSTILFYWAAQLARAGPGQGPHETGPCVFPGQPARFEPLLGIYFLSFDRAGYGVCDPNPKPSVKSEAMDVEELADQLEIGLKFYLIGAYPQAGILYGAA